MTIAATFAVQTASACTSFKLRTSDGATVYGRTMEFGFPLQSEMLVIPRNFSLKATAPGKANMAWTSKYAAVGLNAMGETALVDGVNEKGLAGGVLYFPGYAGYADSAKTDANKALAPWDFLTWALSNFATVAEVKAALGQITVVDVANGGLGITPPLHYTLHDADGNSLVVEPIGGTLKVYDNPLGVMTNAPSFDWHLTNLKNYVKLEARNAPPLKLGDVTITGFGQGSGLLGIPGDPTPPSRFIRALGYTQSAELRPKGIESVRLAEHILNGFDIPRGWIRGDSGKDTAETPYEFTQWSAIADLSSKIYYVKAYDDQVLRQVDLMSFDLDAKTLSRSPLKPQMAAPAIVFSKP